MFWNRKKKQDKRTINPHTMQQRSFFSGDVDRLLSGWTTESRHIDEYLDSELTQLRARSRELVRVNPYGKRFITAMKANIVGPVGVTVQAQSMRGQRLDDVANTAIEKAFMDWGCYHCDAVGRMDWVDMQNMAISCASQDGEFLFQKVRGRNAGKYGYSLKVIDPEMLDTSKTENSQDGKIRLGVEYSTNGKRLRYWFKDTFTGNKYNVSAREIIHGFISEWPDQSRGIPWMHAGLQTAKHLDKYDEAAIVAARAGANNALILTSDDDGSDAYAGDEDAGDGNTYDNISPGEIRDFGNRSVTSFDPSYPHQMYDAFTATAIRRFSASVGVSYHTISNNLEGVNYSSIRAGVLEDREIFKGIQNWFVRSLIRPVYEDWLAMAVTMGQVKIGTRPLARPVDEYMPAHYQARRWAWVDPQKDSAANEMAINQRLKSRSQIMREQGDDPESIWKEIEREEKLLEEMGIKPVSEPMPEEPAEEPEEDRSENVVDFFTGLGKGLNG